MTSSQIKSLSPIRTLSDLFSQQAAPWRYRNDSLFEHIVRTQAHAARRNITPKHFFRFRKDRSGVTSFLRETAQLKKQFDAPIPAYLYVRHNKPEKPLKPTGVDDQVGHEFRVDIAECIRLGELFGEVDDVLNFHFYLPRAGDVYQWNYSLYTIEEVTGAGDGYYEPLQRFIVWSGAAKLLRGDSTDPNRPAEVQGSDPEIEQPIWPK